MAHRNVPHEITLFAFVRDGAGLYSITDIIETSFHHASSFARRWYRDADIVEMAAMSPGVSLSRAELHQRRIYREQG